MAIKNVFPFKAVETKNLDIPAPLRRGIRWSVGMPGRVVFSEKWDLIPRKEAIFNVGGTYAQGEMEKALLANPDWEIVGTNSTAASAARATNGLIRLTTTTTSGDSVILSPLSEATILADGSNSGTYTSKFQATRWDTTKCPWARFQVVLSDLTTGTAWAGFKLTNVDTVATDDDQAYFRIASTDGAGTWDIVTSTGGSDEVASTSIDYVEDKLYILDVFIDKSRYAHYGISTINADGNIVSNWFRSTAQVTNSLVTLKPFVGVKTGASAEAFIDVGEVVVSREI